MDGMDGTPIAFLSIHGDPLAPLGGPSHGGQNVYVRELAREMATRGFPVDVYSRWEWSEQAPVEDIGPNAGVVRIQVGPAHYLPKERTVSMVSTLAKWIQQYWQETQTTYQLLHAHYYISGAVALHLRRLYTLPLIQTFHSLGAVKRASLGDKDPSPLQRHTLEQRIVDEADRIVATTEQEHDDLINYYDADPSRIVIIPCGVDLDLFRNVPFRDAREHIGIAVNQFLILYVGRLAKRKGIDTLLEAIGLLHRAQPDLPVQVVIVGGRPEEHADQAKMRSHETAERRRLQHIIDRHTLNDWVTFTGGVPQEVLPYYYGAADVTVVPSYYEPFGMTAIEALACGSSVIASNVGGLKSTIREGQVGLRFEPRNAPALKGRLAHLIANPAVNATFRRNARPYVEQRYGWSVIAEQMAAVYEEVLTQ